MSKIPEISSFLFLTLAQRTTPCSKSCRPSQSPLSPSFLSMLPSLLPEVPLQQQANECPLVLLMFGNKQFPEDPQMS